MSPLTIFWSIVLPVFILLAVGFALDKAFRLDITTLVRINFYVFSPAIVFLTLVKSNLQASDILSIVGFTVVHEVILAAIAFGLFSLRPFVEKRTVLTYGAVFYNSGNYGFPLMLLAFGPGAVGVIAIVLVVQIIFLFTVGMLSFVGGQSARESLGRLLRTPVIYAVILGLALRGLGINLEGPLVTPIDRLGEAFIAMALLTLGVQLARSPFAGDALRVSSVSVLRLAVSPLLAAGLAALLRLPAEIGMVLVVGAGLPVAVNIFILATEFNHDAEFASRIVFWTTLLSVLTIPVLLWLVQ